MKTKRSFLGVFTVYLLILAFQNSADSAPILKRACGKVFLADERPLLLPALMSRQEFVASLKKKYSRPQKTGDHQAYFENLALERESRYLPKKDSLALMVSNEDRTRFILPKALVPEAPEVILYNWRRENLENLTVGFAPHSLNGLLRRGDSFHMGLYLATDPYSYASYGVLMEVVLYDQAFPVQKNGEIKWVKVEDMHFRRDLGAGQDIGNGFPGYFDKAFTTTQFVVSDLRVIKELRFPNKALVLEAWRFAEADQRNSGNSSVQSLGAQWMVTPNYSFENRVQIVNSEFQKAFLYLSGILGLRVPHTNISLGRLSPEAVQVQNLLEAILGVAGSYVDPVYSTINHFALHSAMRTISDEKFNLLRDSVRKGGSNEKVLDALELAIYFREGLLAQWEAKRQNILQKILNRLKMGSSTRSTADGKKFNSVLKGEELELTALASKLNVPL